MVSAGDGGDAATCPPMVALSNAESKVFLAKFMETEPATDAPFCACSGELTAMPKPMANCRPPDNAYTAASCTPLTFASVTWAVTVDVMSLMPTAPAKAALD